MQIKRNFVGGKININKKENWKMDDSVSLSDECVEQNKRAIE